MGGGQDGRPFLIHSSRKAMMEVNEKVYFLQLFLNFQASPKRVLKCLVHHDGLLV